MSCTKEELANSWLFKINSDLLSAGELVKVKADSSLKDTASYHCQLVAESYGVAFLFFHDLEVLESQAQPVDQGFSVFLAGGRIITLKTAFNNLLVTH